MRVFGLIGFPLGHSFSKSYFTTKFQQEKIAARYETFAIKSIEELPAIFEENPQLCGLNVTIPYKEKIISYLHNIEPEAKKIGAVNTIRIEKVIGNIELTGYNTDAAGFELSLIPGLNPSHSHALILGSGGASKAVCFVLDKLNIKWQIVSRKPAGKQMIAYSALNAEKINSSKLIINTTPLGMFPNIASYPEIPYDYISPEHYLYDLVYNPEETIFMKNGLRKGAKVKNGLEMLKIQAEKAWEIWNL